MNAGMTQETITAPMDRRVLEGALGCLPGPMVPHIWEILKDNEISHCWQNFLIAAGEAQGEHSGPPFYDGDFYKWLEAAARVYGDASDGPWAERLDHLPYPLKWSRHREAYITSFCCLPNVVRTLAETPDTICVSRNNGVAFLMYGEGRVAFRLAGGAALEFQMNSAYPWDGEIELIVERGAAGYAFPVYLRIPAWAEAFTLAVNGEPVGGELTISDGFVAVERAWRTGDRIHLSLPMDVVLVESHPMLEETRNHVAATLVPYFAWDNRARGEMTVWLPLLPRN